MNLPETSIIGVGGLGSALARGLLSKKVLIKSVFNRTERKARQLASTANIEICGTFPSTADALGKLVFITVPDDAIEEVARQLSELSDDFSESIFVHCSGTQSADLLQPLKSKGGITASFHPLQTFTTRAQPDDFKDIYFSLQGDAEAFPLLQKVAQQLGAKTFEVTTEQKAHLHAAAVMASNYLTVLIDRSVEIGTLGGLAGDQVRKALMPLIRGTLENNEKYSAAAALTGPIKRGDIETIEKHLALLDDQSELRDLYCALGLQAVQVIESTGDVDNLHIDKLRKILS